MIGLTLLILILAIFSILSSILVLVYTLLPFVFRIVSRKSRHPGHTGDLSHLTFAADPLAATAGIQLRSADRVQAWLALFDIIAAIAVIVYWVIFVTAAAAAAEGHAHIPSSPFVDPRTSFLLATSTCLRPASLTLVSGLSFLTLRRGNAISLGTFDWTLWTTSFATTFTLSLLCWTLSISLSQSLSRNTLPGTLIGFHLSTLR